MNASTKPVRIDGELTIFRVMELKALLLGDPPASVIDLGGVTDFDTAGLQLLMMVKRVAQSQGRDVELVNHSPVVLEVMDLLNVAGFFGDPVLIDSRSPRSN